MMTRSAFVFCLALSIALHLGLMRVGFDGGAPPLEKPRPVAVHLSPRPSAPLPFAEEPALPPAPSSPATVPPPKERMVSAPAPAISPRQALPSEPVIHQSSPPTPAPSEENALSSSPPASPASPSPAPRLNLSADRPPSTASDLTLTPPRYAETPRPPYPGMAERRRLEGTVWLDVQVSAAGDVTDLRVERSSGHTVLDRAAERAVRGWRFHPARLGAEAVEGRAIVPVEFRLQEG